MYILHSKYKFILNITKFKLFPKQLNWGSHFHIAHSLSGEDIMGNSSKCYANVHVYHKLANSMNKSILAGLNEHRSWNSINPLAMAVVCHILNGWIETLTLLCSRATFTGKNWTTCCFPNAEDNRKQNVDPMVVSKQVSTRPSLGPNMAPANMF